MDEEQRRRLSFAEAVDKWHLGRITRREFVRRAILTGFGAYMASSCTRPRGMSLPLADIKNDVGPDSPLQRQEQQQFFKEACRRFAGTTLHIISEATSPSYIIRNFAMEEFARMTGIRLDWELLPLDRLLSKMSSDTARKVGKHDVFYVDQQWIARFANDLVDIGMLLQQSDLAYPGYQFSDILPELIHAMSTFKGQLVGIPFDILIQIMIYRRDIFEKLGLPLPRTMPEYLQIVRRIDRELSPRIHGTTGMWKSGNISLYADFVSYLWAHGGSIFLADGSPAVGDDNAVAALNYMNELSQYMPPAVTTWDWAGEARSFARGEAAIMFQVGEWFSMFDDPKDSQIPGLAEAAPCPLETSLRPAKECGFSEIPGISRQHGGALCISRYSKNRDAAWIFIQWATSREITTRSCLMGGANPIRLSNYQDPRILKQAGANGVTRHFAVTLDAIRHRMGTDPRLPGFTTLAVDNFAVELGQMTTGQQNAEETARAMERAAMLATLHQ